MSALLAAVAVLVTCPRVSAQDAPPPTPSAELDQALVNLPTTMPLGRHKSYFRLTHRFARDLLRDDGVGELAKDLFGLDNGAIIGLEYRFGITKTLQAGVHRTILGKTIVTWGRWDAVREADAKPVSLSTTVSIEGQNNLRQDPQPALSATLSHVQGKWLALYATPTYVHNAHTETLRTAHGDHAHDVPGQDSEETSDDIDTFFVGLGARLRMRDTVTLVGEVSPRLGGYTPATAVWAVAIEKLTRGHVLQLNFGNSFGTTPGMLARGGASGEVYLGFNMSRKF